MPIYISSRISIPQRHYKNIWKSVPRHGSERLRSQPSLEVLWKSFCFTLFSPTLVEPISDDRMCKSRRKIMLNVLELQHVHTQWTLNYSKNCNLIHLLVSVSTIYYQHPLHYRTRIFWCTFAAYANDVFRGRISVTQRPWEGVVSLDTKFQHQQCRPSQILIGPVRVHWVLNYDAVNFSLSHFPKNLKIISKAYRSEFK